MQRRRYDRDDDAPSAFWGVLALLVWVAVLGALMLAHVAQLSAPPAG